MPADGLRERVRARRARIGREALLDEDADEEARQFHVVLDDQDLHPSKASIGVTVPASLQKLNPRLTLAPRMDGTLYPR